jgi:hypothetical protein
LNRFLIIEGIILKVVGCKVEDEIYYKIKEENENVSEFIRKLITGYFDNLDHPITKNTVFTYGLPLVNQDNSFDEYQMLCRTLDSLKRRYRKDSDNNGI